jgi:NhaP-type Na+/H+ or K+/H+ antiporter
LHDKPERWLPQHQMLAIWFLVLGAVLMVMGFARRVLQPLPLSTGIVYVVIGFVLGPVGVELLNVEPNRDVKWIEIATEVAVLISLFAVGLKIEVGFSRAAWRVPVRLASGTMVVSIALIALLAHLLLGVDWALALLIGAVLAPTDPVLASDVQVHDPADRDRMRFSLTAEGGLNDGTAFPAVMLGLVLLGLRDGGQFGWLWVARDLLWAVSAGLAIGWLAGLGLAQMVERLRQRGLEIEFEEFLVLGTIAFAYGLAVLLQAYGFLAVFAAALAFRHGERQAHDALEGRPDNVVAPRLQAFAEQAERIAEVAVVILVGVMLSLVEWSWTLLAFSLAVLVVARPIAVYALLPRGAVMPHQRRLIAWFGVRGIGSIYYLSYALHHGVADEQGQNLLNATLATVALSVLLHGTSATPLMRRYMKRQERAGEKPRVEDS